MELLCKKRQLKNGLEVHSFTITSIYCMIMGPQEVLYQMTRCRLIFDYECETCPDDRYQKYHIKCVDTTKEVCRYEI